MLTTKLKAFLDLPCGMGIGTCDANLVPEFQRLLGSSVMDDHRIRLYMDQPSGERTLQNIRENDHISVVMVDVTRADSYQFKGRCVGIEQMTQHDQQKFEQYLKDFDIAAQSVGFWPGLIYRYPHSSMVAVIMEVHEVFEQTPKKNTGSKVI
jgi:hypothetical protein